MLRSVRPHTTHRHAFEALGTSRREGLVIASRRNMLKASLAGMAGLSVPRLLESQAKAREAGQRTSRKSVILLWMAGGPSHIDMWDPKPDRPLENRGPFGVTASKLPGVFLCEHLPKQAAILDRLTLIRSVDCRFSSHEPNEVFQTANRAAEARENPEAEKYPASRSRNCSEENHNRAKTGRSWSVPRPGKSR